MNSVSPQDVNNAIEVESQGATLTIGETINVTWNPLSVIDNNLFQIDTPKVDISLLRYKEDEEEWEVTAMLATDLPNNGHTSVRLPDVEPLDESRSLDLTLIQMTLNTSTSIAKPSRMKRSTSRVLRTMGRFSKALVIGYLKTSTAGRLLCEVWHLADRGVDERCIPPCPCRKDQAEGDSRYVQETGTGADILREYVFHPGSESCYRQTTARQVLTDSPV